MRMNPMASEFVSVNPTKRMDCMASNFLSSRLSVLEVCVNDLYARVGTWHVSRWGDLSRKRRPSNGVVHVLDR
eukprot:305748-Pyramimonas_sp.AAC.1